MPKSVPQRSDQANNHAEAGSVSSIEYLDADLDDKASAGQQLYQSKAEARIAHSTALTWLAWSFAICIQCLCALVISQYDALHQNKGDTLLFGVQLPSAIVDPSAIVFINAVIIFGIAVLICYDIRRTDAYQDLILTLAVLCGSLVAGSTAAYDGVMESFKIYIPGAITLSLLVSPVVQGILTTFLER